MGCARRRRRSRVHRTFYHQGKGLSTPERWGAQGDHLRARRQGCRCHDRLRRESCRTEGIRHGDLERLVHDELPGAARQTAARKNRRAERADDHDPRLYQRPGPHRCLSRGPAPRALRHALDDPDQDRRRGRGRARDAGAQRQARRLRDPRSNDQRVDRRSVVHRRTRHDGRRGQRDHAGGLLRRTARGLARLQRRSAGVERLQPRPALVDLRCDIDQGLGPPRQGLVVVRQRMGLLQPDARYDGRASGRSDSGVHP